MGLGLAVVHGIVTDHGGTIAVEESALGGARFVARFPSLQQSAAPTSPDTSSRPLDILVIDSGSTDAAFLERFLGSRGHAVVRATSADSALRLAASEDGFNVVICDASLRAADGAMLSDALLRSPGCRDARFLLVADQGRTTHRARAADGRSLTSVARPYDIEEVRRLIEEE